MVYTSCGHTHDEHVSEHSHADGLKENRELSEHEDGVIIMSADDARFFGVHSDTIFPAPFADVIHVSGQLDSAPSDVYTAASSSAGIVSLSRNILLGSTVSAGTTIATVSARNMAGGDPNENAYVAMANARRELDRLTPLHADGIVSTRDYNAAEAEYQRAKAAYSGARTGSSVISRLAGTVTEILVKDGEFVETGTPIAVITDGARLTVRADVPVRYYTSIGDKVSGNIKFAGSDRVYPLDSLNARRISGRAVSMSGAFVPVFFEIDNIGRNLVAGMVADVYLAGEGENDIIAVPSGAVSEQQGVYFVYVKLDDDCYRKVPVTIGRTDGQRVEIVKGVRPGTAVVTDGMTFVRLAESNGVVPEGHTHSH